MYYASVFLHSPNGNTIAVMGEGEDPVKATGKVMLDVKRMFEFGPYGVIPNKCTMLVKTPDETYKDGNGQAYLEEQCQEYMVDLSADIKG